MERPANVVLLFAATAERRRELRSALEREAHRCREVGNLRELADALGQGPDDVAAALVDLSDASGSGYAALKALNTNATGRRIPAVALLGIGGGRAQGKALSLGALSCVQGPCDPRSLLHALDNVIRLCGAQAPTKETQAGSAVSLSSREEFLDRATRMISGHEPGHYVLSYLNILRFTALNKRYGERRGDEVLAHVARSLASFAGPLDAVGCHYVSDRFVLLYPRECLDSKGPDLCRAQAENPPGLSRGIKINVGRCVADDPSVSVRSLVSRAALAEESIRSRYDAYVATFDESMRSRLLFEQEIASEMFSALHEGQFEMWLQPQYDHATGVPIGAEALVRWHRPKSARLVLVEGIIDDQSALWGLSNSDAIIKDIINSQLPEGPFSRLHAERIYTGEATLLGDLADVLRWNVTGSVGDVREEGYRALLEFGLVLVRRKGLSMALDTRHCDSHHFRVRFGNVVDFLDHTLAERGGPVKNYELYRKVTFGRDLLVEADPGRFTSAPAQSYIQYAVEDFDTIGLRNDTCAYLADAFSILNDTAIRIAGNPYARITPDSAELRDEWVRTLTKVTQGWGAP